jgi:hypothetical protein
MDAYFAHVSVLVVVLNAIGLGTLMVGIGAFLRKPPTAGLKISGILIAWMALPLPPRHALVALLRDAIGRHL